MIKNMLDEDKARLVSDVENYEGSKVDHMKKVAAEWGIGLRTLYYRYNQLKNEDIDDDTSTLYGSDGEVKLQWVKKKKDDKSKLKAYKKAVDKINKSMTAPRFIKPSFECIDENLTVYISNDVHLGGLAISDETRDRDWNEDIAVRTVKKAIDELVDRAPSTKEAVVADLGDLLEMNNGSNMTPKSGNVLDVSTRYPYVLRLAMELMVYMVDSALYKHDKVYFYNVGGNHDNESGYAINAFVKAWFKDEPRVVVEDTTGSVQYHKHGSTLLGFTHGDGVKMQHAGEVMAMHNESVWSETRDRYFHFGHNHKDSVVDGRLCKAESHRNVAPVNAWAAGKGYGRNAGTMKAIVYSPEYGKETEITYNVRKVDAEDN